MRIRGPYESASVFCDTGVHAGLYRVDIRASVYLTEEEVQRKGTKDFVIALPPDPMQKNMEKE